MTGSITFNLPSNAIARFDLGSIQNVHTDGSGVLQFNVTNSATEFDFTCADEAAAQRILHLIFDLKQQGFGTNYEVTDAVNYPLPPIPVITHALLYYDYLNNAWYIFVDGTNMDSVGYVIFAGVKAMLVSAIPSAIQSETINKPAYGDLELDCYDARDNLLASTTISFHYTITTFLPNPFVVLVDNVTVNGSDFVNATIGTVYVDDVASGSVFFNGLNCPATFVDQFALSCPSGDWGLGDDVTTPPLILQYKDSTGKLSNAVYVSTVV